VRPEKLAVNFVGLNLYAADEQLKALAAALQEITARDYSGKHPPEKSYEAGMRDDDLFAFAWDSAYFRKRMYFKFCLHKDNVDDFSLRVASLHRENPRKREERS
jgi:hypothetical protein